MSIKFGYINSQKDRHGNEIGIIFDAGIKRGLSTSLETVVDSIEGDSYVQNERIDARIKRYRCNLDYSKSNEDILGILIENGIDIRDGFDYLKKAEETFSIHLKKKGSKKKSIEEINEMKNEAIAVYLKHRSQIKKEFKSDEKLLKKLGLKYRKCVSFKSFSKRAMSFYDAIFNLRVTRKKLSEKFELNEFKLGRSLFEAIDYEESRKDITNEAVFQAIIMRDEAFYSLKQWMQNLYIILKRSLKKHEFEKFRIYENDESKIINKKTIE